MALDQLLLVNGTDNLILQTGDDLLLQSAVPPPASAVGANLQPSPWDADLNPSVWRADLLP